MKHITVLWICRVVAALLLLQTLYFKFTGAEESVFIFSQMGIEPWGRYLTGTAELIASALILFPATSVIGAVVAAGIMFVAIISHLFILGVEVRGDGGLLFAYACIVLVASVYIIITGRHQLLAFFAGSKMPS
jgi:uncharacterized membrane protein YphA (DoxX/SURF4 family)